MSKGQVKISSMNRIYYITDLINNLENIGCDDLSIYMLLLQLSLISTRVLHD